jgi:ORF6N domain
MAIILKPENVAQLVFFVRGEKVMLDADLARLYGVTTGNLNKAVKRNQGRFPGDFMFQLTDKETEGLIFQSGRSKGRGGRRHRPYAFTEQGVAMLSTVLNSERAVQVNIAIMRTFVQLRRLMDSNADLARKIESLEKKYDEKFATVFAAIKQLIAPPTPAKKRIGFHPDR